MSSSSKQQKPTLEEYKTAEYVKLGFTDYEARRLVDVPGLDVGTLRKILSRGCPVKIAYRIYRP